MDSSPKKDRNDIVTNVEPGMDQKMMLTLQLAMVAGNYGVGDVHNDIMTEGEVLEKSRKRAKSEAKHKLTTTTKLAES